MILLKRYMAFFALISLLFSSCSKDETANVGGEVGDNAASIYFGPVLADLGNQFTRQQEQDIPECSIDEPAYAQIMLTYGDDDTPIDVVVEILQDDQGLFTAYDDALEIPIPSGETTVSVTLTDFVVWNDIDGEPGIPIWVAPKAGSEYAQFVSDPLSNTFSLRAGSKNYVNVDVICFDDRDVNLYGYQFFDINPVPLYDLCVFANYCTDAGRHYTADYTFALYEYDADAEDGKGEIIYEGLTPNKGVSDGTYWADPLCVVIPGPGDTGADQPYLVIEANLSGWTDYYTPEDDDELVITQNLSWNMIQMLFNEDGDDQTTEYWHIFFNCENSDVPDCDINDPEEDCDNDGIPNGEDNCPQISNQGQEDLDEDGIGDVCDSDRDGDGADNGNDPCPDDATDSCVDDCADLGGDTDGDGICDDNDNCPETPNQDQADLDDDGIGDACDSDRDGDGTDNGEDPCPDDATDSCVDECADLGGDTDGDGICDDNDNCPGTANPDQADFDGDDIGDVCDPDIDNDGVPNAEDDCDFEVPVVDEDGDGCEDETGEPDPCLQDPNTSLSCETASFSGDVSNDFPIDLMLDGNSIGSLTFEIIDGDIVLGVALTVIGGYLIDDIEILYGDEIVCYDETEFPGVGSYELDGSSNFSYPLNGISVRLNVCPAN